MGKMVFMALCVFIFGMFDI